jgi:peptide/nickel transport system substrate-binding protein
MASSAVALLAACGNPPPTPSATSSAAPTSVGVTPASTSVTTPAAAAASTPQPVSGGSMRFAITADLATLDGHSRTPGSYESNWLCYDQLLNYDDKLQPQPMLAESWDLTPDYKQITFHLRPGVMYHSGREFTSDDVKYNVLRVRDVKVASGLFTQQSNWFSAIDTPDKYTVVLKSDQPRPAMFDFFDTFNMLDKDTMEGPDAKDKEVGTGPFVFVERSQGDHLTFSKNPNYWQTGRPYIDSWTALVRDYQSAIVQLEAGALDGVRNPTVTDIVRLKSDPKYVNVVHPSPGTFFEFGISVKQPPFDNKLVRQALNYAFNRQRLVDTAYAGTAEAVSLPWSKTSPAYDAQKNMTYTFDPDKARSLLAQAGVTGLQVDVLLPGGGYPTYESFMPAYQEDLKNVGIQMNINTVTPAVWIDQANNVKYTGMVASGDAGANVSPANLLDVSPAWRVNPNNEGFDDPMWKQLVNAVETEVDPTKQKDLYARMNDFMLDQSWIVVPSSLPASNVTTTNVHGMVPNQHGGFTYINAWIG